MLHIRKYKDNIMASFIGSIWFACLLCVVGYIAGSVVPVSKLPELFKKK
jgi:hypothetical protein